MLEGTLYPLLSMRMLGFFPFLFIHTCLFEDLFIDVSQWISLYIFI